MVLEDVSAPSSSTDFASSYDTPTSDEDPYDSSPSYTAHVFLASEFPRPAPIIGPLFGVTTSRVQAAIQARITAAVTVLQRPLSTDEATALAYWTAKMHSVASWGRPLGLAAGAYTAYSKRATYRFPFVTPSKETFNPQSLKIGPVEILKGNQARVGWHILRGTAYGLMGSWVGGMLAVTYAATVAAVGEQQDPRLKELVATLMQKTRAGRGDIPQGVGVQVGHRGDPTGQGERSASELWRNHRGSIGEVDDASPSAGGGFEDDDGGALLARNNNNSGGLMSDEQRRAQELSQRADGPRKSSTMNPSRASTFEIEKVERQPRSFDDNYDTTTSSSSNPTSGTGPGSTDTSSGGGGGSVWDRIRREAGSTPSASAPTTPANRRGRRSSPPTPTQQDQREGFSTTSTTTTGDSFAFSRSSSEDDDRQPARDEAQREFDARVEAERRGGDFGAEREKRW
ncbi:hypothetical protein MMC24_005924 [Lignoscripta atroalba]|nr:hypothetical protein [Lignoscripta atroalba]